MPKNIERYVHRRRSPWTFILLTAVGLTLPTVLLASPELEFTSGTVTASGITPAGCTVLFGVAHERVPWMRRLVTHVKPQVDADGTGEVTFAPGAGVPETSVWTAVDIENGAFSAGAPVGFELVESEVDWRTMTEKPGSLIDQRQNLELVVIRPGIAAWHGRAFDGAVGDDGVAEDGAIEVRLDGLERIWPHQGGRTAPVLDGFESGDVVVGIDPVLLDTWSFTFGSHDSSAERTAR